jgi:hypothetical protein
MSLIRQIWLLMLGTVLLAFAGSVTVAVESARGYLQTQLRLKNADNATSLALALSQQKGDKELMALLMSAQFDTGFYRRIRFSNADSSLGFVREAQATPTTAPAWFVNLAPIESEPGVAQVSDGWRALGAIGLAALVAALPALAVNYSLHTTPWIRLCAAGTVYIAGYVSILVALNLLHEDERTWLWSWADRTRVSLRSVS